MDSLNATYRVQAAVKDTTGDLVKRLYAVHNDTARRGHASYAGGEVGGPPPKVVTVLIGSNDLHAVHIETLPVGVQDPYRGNVWNYHDRYAAFFQLSPKARWQRRAGGERHAV
jgi:hypothetical protein